MGSSGDVDSCESRISSIRRGFEAGSRSGDADTTAFVTHLSHY